MWILALLACTPEVELLDHSRWTAQGCAAAAISIEESTLEIDTVGCSPVRATQVLQEPVRVGDELEVVWWHSFLNFEQPAMGYFRLYLDDTLIYEAGRAIPAPPANLIERFKSPAAGERLTVEVENHGANTWDLLRLTRVAR